MGWLSDVLRNLRSAQPSSCIGANLGATPAVQAMYMYFTAAYQPILPHSPIQKHFIKSVCSLPNSQRCWPLIGSGPACLWENCPIRAHSSPVNFLVCALWVTCTDFSSPPPQSTGAYTQELLGKCPRRRGAKRSEHRWMDLITPTWSHFISFIWGNIHLTCTGSFYFAL